MLTYIAQMYIQDVSFQHYSIVLYYFPSYSPNFLHHPSKKSLNPPQIPTVVPCLRATAKICRVPARTMWVSVWGIDLHCWSHLSPVRAATWEIYFNVFAAAKRIIQHHQTPSMSSVQPRNTDSKKALRLNYDIFHMLRTTTVTIGCASNCIKSWEIRR